MKRIRHLLMAFAMLFTVLGVFSVKMTARADEWEDNEIYVAGKLVTNANKNDVLGDGGSVRYDTTTHTMTLKNATINAAQVTRNSFAGINVTISYDNGSFIRDFRIVLEGKNKIIVPDNFVGNSEGINTGAGIDLTISGSGSLDIDIGNSAADCYGIEGGTVTIWGGNIHTSLGKGLYKSDSIRAWQNLTIYGGSVTCEYKKMSVEYTQYGFHVNNYIYMLGGTVEIHAETSPINLVEGESGLNLSGFPSAPEVMASQNYDGSNAVSADMDKLVGEYYKYIRIGLANPFTDVKKGAYYYDAVLWAYYYDPSITTGTNPPKNDKFAPSGTCTRGHAVTFLYRMNGEPAVTVTNARFTDVKDSSKFYYTPVYWAYQNGVTSGTNPPENTLFSPKKNCTRAQFVTFLWKLEGKPGHTISNPFTDVKPTSAYYDAILWAYENGITTGTSDTTFSPGKELTRGQAVTFLYRYYWR